MKRINKGQVCLVIAILLMVSLVIAAKWSDYGDFGTSTQDTDSLLILDVSDTTLAATGTQKQWFIDDFKTWLAAWFAALTDVVADSHVNFSQWENFTLLDPADGDDPLIGPIPIAITITSLKCVTLGGGDIDVDLQECDANGANCASGGIAVADVSTTVVTDTSFTDAAIDADDYLKAVLTNQAGTTDQLGCNFEYTR